MSTTTNLTSLKINYLTQAQYETALSGGNINENELYFTPNDTPHIYISTSDPTSADGNNGDIWFIYEEPIT